MTSSWKVKFVKIIFIIQKISGRKQEQGPIIILENLEIILSLS